METEEPEDEGGFGTGETDMLADLMKNEAAAGVQDSRGRRDSRTIADEPMAEEAPPTPRPEEG